MSYIQRTVIKFGRAISNTPKSKGLNTMMNWCMRSIEQTHKIAFDRIESFLPDNTVRLPEFVVPAGFTATQALVNYALEGLKDKGLHKNKEYTDRLAP